MLQKAGLLFLIVLNSNVLAEVRVLETFYDQLDQAALVLKSRADLEAQRAQLMASEAQKGWEFFGSIAGGYRKSPFAREPFGRFFDPLLRVGLRYPLLGSAEKQKRAINDAATDVEIEDIRLGWSKRLAILFMEENYAAYWSAQKLLILNESYLNLRDNGVEKKLLERQKDGLLLASDYYEFISAFEQAERSKIEFDDNVKLALERLSHLTNETIVPFSAIKPLLAEIQPHVAKDIKQLDLAILQARINNLKHVRETENWQGVDSDFSAVAFGGPAIPYPSPDGAQFGYGGAIGLSIRMPLEIVDYRKHERSRVNSQLHSLNAEYRQRDQELDLEFNTLLSQYHRLAQQINFQHMRLKAARESVRERYLRLQFLDGDVFEKYLQAVNQYYSVAVEYIETETEHWKLHIRLRQFINVVDNTDKAIPAEVDYSEIVEPLEQAGLVLEQEFLGNTVSSWQASRDTVSMTEQVYLKQTHSHLEKSPKQTHLESESFAVYVWDYDELRKHDTFWKQSKSLNINRVLLSLNGHEIASVVADASELQRIVSNARHDGIKIELLLGDPDWILPENRDDLLQIIRELRHIDFDGLHLDIEPDQLKSELQGRARLEAFIETIRQAAMVSPWPVGISMHPRYLEEVSSYTLCVPCELQAAKVKEIAVMYYSMNIERIVQTLKAAMQGFPDLVFSLAQSVERELGPENSYATKPEAVFKQAMRTLHRQLQSSNFRGLIIQSWQEWKDYLYEDSL